MAEQPSAAPPAAGPDGGGQGRAPLWFLADRDAFLRRFVLRTLLRPPPFRRGPRPRAFER